MTSWTPPERIPSRMSLAPLAPDPSREQRQPVARVPQVSRKCPEVLLGQDLRRRHESGLESVLQHHHHGLEGDDGLARAHVPVEQPSHNVAAPQIADDLAHHSLLGGRGMEGKNPLHHLANPIVDLDPPGLGQGLPVPAHHLETQVKQEELLEDESALRRSRARLQVLQVGLPLPVLRPDGEMEFAPRPAAVREAVLLQQPVRNRVLDVPLQFGHGAMDDGAQ